MIATLKVYISYPSQANQQAPENCPEFFNESIKCLVHDAVAIYKPFGRELQLIETLDRD